MRLGPLVVAIALWLAVADLRDPFDLALGVAAAAAALLLAARLRRALAPPRPSVPRLRRPARLLATFAGDLRSLATNLLSTDAGRWTDEPYPDGLAADRSSDRALAIAVVSALPGSVAAGAGDQGVRSHRFEVRER